MTGMNDSVGDDGTTSRLRKVLIIAADPTDEGLDRITHKYGDRVTLLCLSGWEQGERRLNGSTFDVLLVTPVAQTQPGFRDVHDAALHRVTPT